MLSITLMNTLKTPCRSPALCKASALVARQCRRGLTGSNEVERLNNITFHRTLRSRSDHASLVFFSAPGCGSCKSFNRVLTTFQQKAKERAGLSIDVYEVDAGESMGLVNEHDVFHLPALFLYDRGEYYASIQATPDVDSILSAIQTALSCPAEEPP